MKTTLAILFTLFALVVMQSFFTREPPLKEADYLRVAHLSQGDTSGLAAIRQAFTERNPGYDLHYYGQVTEVPGAKEQRLAFVQQGGGTARFPDGTSSKISVGDIIHLPPQQSMTTDSLIDMLVFTVPEPIPDPVPTFIRPDWDDHITDTPGGCATDTGAYRRILLTWKEEVGPYVYHALNAHRVRITDSFTHYHPLDGGFDEFYLVQMVQPDARLITSNQMDKITHPESVQGDQVDDLLQATELAVGDLVYLPRGVVHRGVGGVLAQVITVPGFIPGSEIGVDHHLRRITERFSQTSARLPYQEEGSKMEIIR